MLADQHGRDCLIRWLTLYLDLEGLSNTRDESDCGKKVGRKAKLGAGKGCARAESTRHLAEASR